MEKIKLNINAKAFKRMLSFFIDLCFVNFFKVILVQFIVMTKSHTDTFNNFLADFRELFGIVHINNIKDYHIRYFVNSEVFNYCVQILFILCFTGILYNFLCYCLLNSSTLGQKFLSLKLVDIKNNEKPNIFKMLLKAILVSFPLISLSVLSAFVFLFLIQFHLYAPIENNLAALIIVKITYISNPYIVLTLAVFFIFFWYGLYFLNTNNLLLSDIISRTKVIDYNKKIIIDKALESGAITVNKKDFVYFGDKVISKLENVNKYLYNVLINGLSFIKNKFKKNK